MIKSVKRLSAAILSAVMMLTAVATPLGDNLPAVRESTSLTASAASNPFGKWQTINGVTTIRCTYYAWQQHTTIPEWHFPCLAMAVSGMTTLKMQGIQ